MAPGDQAEQHDQAEERKAPRCALVIFGASGDLTKRKLLPALRALARDGRLDDEFALIGVARTEMSDDEWAKLCAGDKRSPFAKKTCFRYVGGGYDDPDTYQRLAKVLDECDRDAGTPSSRVFYLSTPPRIFGDVAQQLGDAGLNGGEEGAVARLVVEKPFGWDEESARDLYSQMATSFDEPDIFRIDHYLAKETVQNMLALRFANSVFEPVWNRNWVDNVQITVAEAIGVEGRGGFYENTGAVRDIVQNHVLQVLSLFLMEPPTSFHPEAIRDEKMKLLRSIRTWDGPEDIAKNAVRGQYSRGGTHEEPMAGYREEEGVDPLSSTETFVALRLDIENWRWSGVPVYVRTGKRLPRRTTQVVMEFQRPPHLPMLPDEAVELSRDALIVRVQPDEGVSLRFGAKVPGHEFHIRKAAMDFSYTEGYDDEENRDAYERVILDALIGDPTLFIRADEVGRSWRIVDPLIEQWNESEEPIPLYQAATWGPREAHELIERDGRHWHNEA